MRASLLIAAVIGVALSLTFGLLPQSASAGTRVWVLDQTEVNPGESATPDSEQVSAESGETVRSFLLAPTAEFVTTWEQPPATLVPSSTYEFRVTVTGRLTGGTDTQGFRVHDAILLVNDRWDGRTAVGTGQNCFDPIGADPISCTEPSEGTGFFSIGVPFSGETFSFAVGALNCGACVVRYTYRAETRAPAPTPPPTPAAKGLGIEYSMPARFGKRGKNGLVKYPTKKQIAPRNWRVNFVVRRKDGKPCRRSDRLKAKAGSARFLRSGRNPCRFYGLFAKEGKYKLTVVLTTGKGANRKRRAASRQIVVQDWLIFGLGDSNGSGEGAPDVPKPGLLTPAKWQSVFCDRSANSYQAQTARVVERRDPRTSVTFVHRACSGASITKGVLGRYGGVNPGRTHPPQIAALRNLAQSREIDAVIISIGVNDLGFADLVTTCIERPNCPDRAFPKLTSETTLREVMQQRLDSLPRLYNRLSRALKNSGIPARRVFITEYFDSTKDAQGQTCDPLISTELTAFDRAEAQWAADAVLLPLNLAVRAAATKHGWRLIVGAQEGFRTHGYCSTDPWIVGLTESIANQGDANGTLHSTTRGNTFQASLVSKRMRLDFYKNGRTRVPR